MSSEIEEINRIIEDAEWDAKAEDFVEARQKLTQAKNLAKKIRNEELLNKVLALLKKPKVAGIP